MRTDDLTIEEIRRRCLAGLAVDAPIFVTIDDSREVMGLPDWLRRAGRPVCLSLSFDFEHGLSVDELGMNPRLVFRGQPFDLSFFWESIGDVETQSERIKRHAAILH